MDIKYFVTLKTILETGSFQKAAMRLNYTQSTVTFQVQQLEQEFQMKLFEKIGRKMELTQAGEKALPYIDNILTNAELLRNCGKEAKELRGKLTVAMPDALLCYKMHPLIQAFRKKAPHVELIVQSLTCYEIRESVICGKTDIGIHCDVGGYPQSVTTEQLTEYESCLVASPDLSPSQLDFITPHQRKEVHLITNDPHSLHHKRFLEYLDKKDIVMNGGIEMWSIDATKISVKSNLGIAFLPAYTVEEELKSGTLTLIETQLEDPIIPVVRSYLKNRWVSPQMALFLELLQAIRTK